MNPLFKKRPVFMAFLACILMTIIMSIHGRALQTRFSPWGIVSLELAANENEASLIKNIWRNTISDKKTIADHAIVNTLIDFIYISCYSLFLILFSLRSAELLADKKLMKTAAILAFSAGALDSLENFGMFYTLQQPVNPLITMLTAVAASIKFSLLALVILLLLFCWGKKYFQNRNGYN